MPRGADNSHLVTLVERSSRFVMLIKISGKDTTNVVAALSRHVRRLPATLRRSLTWDRGLEMAQHKDFSVATNVKVYFCDPQSPWQRGSNENTNGLLRQYLPKKSDLSQFTQSDWKISSCLMRSARLNEQAAINRFVRHRAGSRLWIPSLRPHPEICCGQKFDQFSPTFALLVDLANTVFHCGSAWKAFQFAVGASRPGCSRM